MSGAVVLVACSARQDSPSLAKISHKFLLLAPELIASASWFLRAVSPPSSNLEIPQETNPQSSPSKLARSQDHNHKRPHQCTQRSPNYLMPNLPARPQASPSLGVTCSTCFAHKTHNQNQNADYHFASSTLKPKRNCYSAGFADANVTVASVSANSALNSSHNLLLARPQFRFLQNPI